MEGSVLLCTPYAKVVRAFSQVHANHYSPSNLTCLVGSLAGMAMQGIGSHFSIPHPRALLRTAIVLIYDKLSIEN
jgi:hypothetical protein